MRQHVIGVKLSEEEYDTLEQQARELGFYRHGFIKTALRIALGLPVSTRDRDLLRLKRDSVAPNQ